MKTFKQLMDEAGRCWTGYKPVKGKKAFSKGSCVKEEEVELDEGANVSYNVNVSHPHFGEKQHKIEYSALSPHHAVEELQKKGFTVHKIRPTYQQTKNEEVEQIDEDKMDKEIIKHATSGMKPHQIAKKLDIPTEWVHQTMKHQMPKPERDLSDPRTDTRGSMKMGEEVELEELFDIIEEVVDGIAEESNIDPEILWENLEDVSDEELYETAAWRRKEGKSASGGLNAKGIASYRKENPGSKLKKAVTGKVKAGSKAAKRRKSFCARMGGMPGSMKKPNGEPTRKALALRKWKCR